MRGGSMKRTRFTSYMTLTALGFVIGLIGSHHVTMVYASQCECDLQYDLMELESIEEITETGDITNETEKWSGRKRAIAADFKYNYNMYAYDAILYVQYSGKEDRKYMHMEKIAHE
jgi:hypothetical protein